MIGARAWILLFGGVSFLTGAAAGALSGRGAEDPVLDSLQAYGAQLEESYQLEPERAAALRVVLASYGEELERVRTRHLPTYHSSMEPELAALGERYGAMIRDKVLPPAARRRFVLESEGLFTPEPQAR